MYRFEIDLYNQRQFLLEENEVRKECDAEFHGGSVHLTKLARLGGERKGRGRTVGDAWGPKHD